LTLKITNTVFSIHPLAVIVSRVKNIPDNKTNHCVGPYGFQIKTASLFYGDISYR